MGVETKPSFENIETSPWGDFELAEGVTGHWRVGPLHLWVSNLEHEWRVAYLQEDDPLESALNVAIPAQALPPEEATSLRFGFGKTGTGLTLEPVLADRSVVVKPEVPLYVPSGEEATLYVSTPVWVRVSLKKTGTLLELPSYRPSDTWFGSSTVAGEFCYASRTAGRLSLDELEFRPHRAVTPVCVRNRADNPLLWERVKLPVQYLAVYRAESRFLWTQQVTLEREEDGDLAGLVIAKNVPKEVGRAVRMSEPRQHADKNLVVRAFSKLFKEDV
ncbi:hypothetical protein BH24DEI2_BH24DEI2_23860 [soil metagenome]